MKFDLNRPESQPGIAGKSKLSRVIFSLIVVSFVAAFLVLPGLTAAKPKPKSKISKAKLEKKIKRRIRYFAKQYAKPLESRDWFLRSIAVIMLSKIDHPKMTRMILDVLKEDKSPLTRAFAWEAMHARVDSLTPKQHRQWVKYGIQAALKGGFRGDMRVDLLKATRSYGPAAFENNVQKMILYFLDNTSYLNPTDSRTLIEIRKLVAAWKDADLCKEIIKKIRKTPVANNAEFVLGGLTKSVKPIGKYVPYKRGKRIACPSASKWAKAAGNWRNWLRKSNLSSYKPGSLALYKGKSRYLPNAKKLTDPNDKTWKDDLELAKLRVNKFDLVFAIDATGSMLPPMQWVGNNMGAMMRIFALISREPRIGVVLFRHEFDKRFKLQCCKKYKVNNKKIPKPVFGCMSKALTGRAGVEAIIKRLLRFNPLSGNYLHRGGAVHGALTTCIKKQPWSKSKNAKKIIILVGDSPLTEGSDKATIELAKQMHKKKGFIIHAITLDWRSDKTFTPVAKAGGGTSISVRVPGMRVKKPPAGSKPEPPAPKTSKKDTHGQIAPYLTSKSRIDQVVIAVIQSAIPKGYHKRIEPFVKILMDYAKATPPKGCGKKP